MSTYKISISKLKGEINPIPSKSTIHRSLIAALLCQGKSEINNIVMSTDVISTLNILKECGCQIHQKDNALLIDSSNLHEPKQINVEESGSTLRFILPVMLYLFNKCNINAKEGLINRPHHVFMDILNQSQIKYQHEQIEFPIQISGKLLANDYVLPGNVSSQFISGLFFVLPLLNEDSKVIFTTNLESKGYLDLTIDVLKEFGIEITENNEGYSIKGGQKYKQNITYFNEIDESNIAFWRVANALGSEIDFSCENENTSQPDVVLKEIIQKKKSVVSVKECPDLLPILSVYGCSLESGLLITDTFRTTIKESNRLDAMLEELSKLGADITKMKNGDLKINYSPKLLGNTVDSHNDHRIVMSLAIASILCDGEVIITDANAINKSYPNFFCELKKLGADVVQV